MSWLLWLELIIYLLSFHYSDDSGVYLKLSILEDLFRRLSVLFDGLLDLYLVDFQFVQFVGKIRIPAESISLFNVFS